MRHLAAAAALTLCAAASAAAQQPVPTANAAAHPVIAMPASLQWMPAPPALPPGAQVAVLEGNPAEPGPFAMRIKLPDGYRIAPHSHPGVERVTVISGTFLLGMGGQAGAAQMQELPAGTFASMPPGTVHFAASRGETILQLNSTGPWTLNYVNPADDPRNQSRN